MADFTQANRPIGITTPLGDDKLLLEKIQGREAISQPFRFELLLLAQPDYTVPFDQLLGKTVTARLDYYLGEKNSKKGTRYFSGVVLRLSEGRMVMSADAGKALQRYRATIVPSFFVLDNRVQSRIFQDLSVPDILKKVLVGVDYSDQTKGAFKARNYCVQYQESDFAFASRLMEEEGIFYFFKHTSSGHQMILANGPTAHSDLDNDAVVCFSSLDHHAARDEARILYWEKFQEIRPGKFTSWDHSFQMPDQTLEATSPIQATSTAGTVSHTLTTANSNLEVYRYPGEYAKRFDGIDKGGGEQASSLSNIIPDGARTAGIRVKQDATSAMLIRGASDCRRLTSGYKFTLAQHPNGNGNYALTAVEHTASVEGTYTSGHMVELSYENRFRCIPIDLPFQPPRSTAKPIMHGTQTALVVGPKGNEIFVDKYGRVKSQFFWDREGQKNSDSSCWMRVAQPWAGKQWGVVFLPRIGDEVVVDFLEGDPDRPIIVGSVYNADQMPPYTLPDNQTQSGIKTRTSLQGTTDNFNELRFEDKKGSEQIFFHAEKDFVREVENNDTLTVGYDKKNPGDQTIKVYNNRTETVENGNESVTIKTGDRTITVNTGNDLHEVKKGNRTVNVDTGNDMHEVKKGNRTVKVDTGNSELDVATGNRTVKVSTGNDVLQVLTGNRTVTVTTGNDQLTVAAGSSITSAGTSIMMSVGANSIMINQEGITITGTMITLVGEAQVAISGSVVEVSGEGEASVVSGGATTVSGSVVSIN